MLALKCANQFYIFHRMEDTFYDAQNDVDAKNDVDAHNIQ